MSDPRLTLVLDGLAAASLEGVLAAERYAPTSPHRCVAAAAPILEAPDAGAQQQDQLIFGEAFEVLDRRGRFLFGQAKRDGYVGFVEEAALREGAGELPTHWVKTPSTLAYARPDGKSAPRLRLSLNSLVTASEAAVPFMETDAGFIAADHLAPIGWREPDPLAVVEAFVAAPYHWGGREAGGVDCSGLVQQALYAAGRAAPRDSDMQEMTLGRPVDPADLRRGDLVFWRGHVGIMVDAGRLMHANMRRMATAVEPLNEVVARMEAAGGGTPSAYRRI